MTAAVSLRAGNVDVYILTGQSNSLGTTNLEGTGFDPGIHPADAQTDFFWSNVSTASFDPGNILLYGDSGGAITTLQMQQGDVAANLNFWGPEFGMARTMFDSGTSNLMFIKLSRGGGGNNFWLPTTGHMHNHLVTQIDAALTAVQNAGDSFEVKGFMYLQGESNNSVEAASADVRLHTLIDNVKAHINTNYSNAAASMYSVIGEIAGSNSNADRITTTNLQQSLAAGSSSIGFIGTRDQPLKSDGIHFGRNAKLEIGRRFADAFNSQEWVENPSLVAGYSANQGTVNAIPHPIAQGLSELSRGVTMVGLNDAGTPVWRIAGNVRQSNPGYQQLLSATDFRAMFDHGWNFKATTKVITGGATALWSISGAANDPGWGVASGIGNTNGFQVSRTNGDELEIRLWQNQAAINLGPGSANVYHTLELRGRAQSGLFDFYVDGGLQIAGMDLTTGVGVAGFENSLIFNTGSGSGFLRDVYWNEVSLTVVPEPDHFLHLVIIGVAFLVNRRHP